MSSQLYHSKLAHLPPPPSNSLTMAEFGIRFDSHPEASELHFWGNPEEGVNPVRWWSWGARLIREGNAHLGNRHAFFSLRVPLPQHPDAPARLHIAVPFITVDDINHGIGLEARQDYDRLMDLVTTVAREMVTAGVLLPARHPIEIIPELLSADGIPRRTHQSFVSMCIAASWLRTERSAMFTGYRHWDAMRNRWGRIESLRAQQSSAEDQDCDECDSKG